MTPGCRWSEYSGDDVYHRLTGIQCEILNLMFYLMPIKSAQAERCALACRGFLQPAYRVSVAVI